MKHRGLALIVVIGILGVLAVLAVAFVAMAQLERRASEQRVNAARAYLLARSGIEDALARLELGQDPAYGGENWDGSPDGSLNAFEADQEVFHRTGAGTPADIESCPVKHALRPSFFAQALPMPNPRTQEVDGRQRGYSGRLSGDYAPMGNSYALKAGAEGSEGQGFYINGGDPSVKTIPTAASDLTGTTAITDYNLNLRRMLGILARAIREEALAGDLSSPGALTLTEADGWALIDNRPSTGWKDWEQVRDLAWGGLPEVSDLKLAALKPYLTLHAYVDKKVVASNVDASILDPNGTWYNPMAITLALRPKETGEANKYEPAKIYHSWGEYKLDPGRRETQPGSRAPDFERIPAVTGRIVGRAPVDLSWARRRRPVLLALLGGLKGLYLDEVLATSIRQGDAIGWLQSAEVILDPVPTAVSDICHKVADRILTSTSELNTWQQWEDFCDALPDTVVMTSDDYARFLAYSNLNRDMGVSTVEGVKGIAMRYAGLPPNAYPLWRLWLKGQAVRDILKANFNPNSRLNKFSPNLSIWKSVDKGDLLVYSTEFSLLPVSYGHQEVESQGRVLDRRGRLLASRAMRALLAGPSPVRLTTQKEFVAGSLGALGVAGDETGFHLPGQAGAPCISVSQGNAGTWGHALPGLGGRGASLQTYPEPVVNDGARPAARLSINPADYDGSVQLATVETAKDGFYSASGPQDPATGVPFRRVMMLGRFTGSFDLDVSAADPDGTAPRVSPFHITPRQNHPDFHQVTSLCTGEASKLIPAGRDSLGNPSYSYQSARQQDSGAPNLAELKLSLLDATKPNTLYPDGCYSELNRAPEYLDQGNADGHHGVMSFWIKANHLPPVAPHNSVYSRGHPILKWTNFIDTTPSAGSPNQFFFWADYTHYMSEPEYPLFCQCEIGHSTSDDSQEHRSEVGRYLMPHRWELLTLRWEFRASGGQDTIKMLLNAGRKGVTPSECATWDAYSPKNDPSMASDITVDDFSVWNGSSWIKGPHRLSLGGRGHPEWEYNSDLRFAFGYGADATFDEFALYDFGGAGPDGTLPAGYAATTKISPEVLAAARYPEGRYYKESTYLGLGDPRNTAAEWFSAPISPGAVCIRGLAWTQIVPPEHLPNGSISLELVDSSGTQSLTGMLTNPAFTPVNRSLRGGFRLHAVFQPNLADPENTPILDPLALDDVTLYYEPLSGARVLAWESGE